MEDTTKQLGTDSILKLIIRFSIPAIIAMTVSALYNIIDRVFIGQFVGENALAGLSIANPVLTIMYGIGAIFSIGASTLASIQLGENKSENGNSIFGNMVLCLFISGILMSATGIIFMKPILIGLGASSDVLTFSMDYLRIILMGLIVQIFSFALACMVRVEGKPMLSMVSQIIAALLNVILDYLFITVFHMGVSGAALATILGQIVGFGILAFYYLSGKSILHIHVKYLKPDFKNIKDMSSLGLSTFFMNAGVSISTSMLNIVLGKYGENPAITTMSAISSLLMLVTLPVYGIQQGIGPIISYNHGMKNQERVQKTLWYAIAIGAAFSTIIWIAMLWNPSFFGSLFLDKNSSTMKMFEHALRIQIFVLPLLPINSIGTAFFQATAQSMKAFILSISRQIMFMIPALLIMPLFMGLTGTWMTAPIADSLSIMLVIVFLVSSRKQVAKKTVTE